MPSTVPRDRSLMKRVAVAVVFAPIIIWIFLARGVPLFIFLVGVTLLGQWELFRMLGERLSLPHKIIGYTSGLIILLDTFFSETASLNGIVISVIIAAFIIEIAAGGTDRFHRVALTLFAAIYPAVFLSFFLLIERSTSLIFSAYMRYLFVFVLVVIWIFDTASYFAGRAFGKHPFFKRVSPKKTLEGFFGGLAGAALTGIFAGLILNRLLIGHFFILSLVIALAGQAGDLSESIIKRELEVKDSSGIIPGHGGILDRFDSLIFAAPAMYLYIIVSQRLIDLMKM